MCLRCSPTLPLLKDHLLWFLSPCEDDGDFQNLVWFFFHWSKFRFIVEGLSGFLILTEMVSHQMPSPRSAARLSGHGANTVNVEHSSIFQRFIILALAAPLPVCTNKNKKIFGANVAESVQPQLPVCDQDWAAAFCFSFEEVEPLLRLQHWLPMMVSASPVTTQAATKAVAASLSHFIMLSLLVFSPSFFHRWQHLLYKHCQSSGKVETIQIEFNNYCKCPTNLVNRPACIYMHNKHKHRQPPYGCLEVGLPFPKKVTGNCGLPANMQHLALQYSCNGFLIFTALDLTQLSLRILIALAFSKTFPRWLFEKHI